MDITSHPHTGDYLAELVKKALPLLESEYGVKVVAAVSDNFHNFHSFMRLTSFITVLNPASGPGQLPRRSRVKLILNNFRPFETFFY